MDWPATALGAASLVVSIVVAWRQQRLARRQEELVERSQASRVWVRFEGFDVARWPDGAPKVFARRGRAPPPQHGRLDLQGVQR